MRFDLFVSRPDVYLYNIVVVGEERQAGGIGRKRLHEHNGAFRVPRFYKRQGTRHSFSEKGFRKAAKRCGLLCAA